MAVQQQNGRQGRSATRPREVPARGWRDILVRTKDEIKSDHVPLLSAGVAFYGMLAIFPALIALITVYGLMVSPQQASQQIGQLTNQLPGSAAQTLETYLTNAVRGSSQALTWGLVASLAGVVWSASSGVGGLIKGINVAYDEEETRGFLKRRLLALVLTLAAIVFAIVAVALIAAVPPLLEQFGLPQPVNILLAVARFALLALLVIFALAVLYRYAPDRDEPRWRWASPGAIVATVTFIAASVGFSFYVRTFGKYGETYGAVAGFIVLMLWLFLTALAVLVGAEINAESERQTRRDTTQGPPQPMGERRADAADELGRSTA